VPPADNVVRVEDTGVGGTRELAVATVLLARSVSLPEARRCRLRGFRATGEGAGR